MTRSAAASKAAEGDSDTTATTTVFLQSPVENADGSISPELAAALKAEAAHYARVAIQEREKMERLQWGLRRAHTDRHMSHRLSTVVPEPQNSNDTSAHRPVQRSTSFSGVQMQTRSTDRRQAQRELEMYIELQRQQKREEEARKQTTKVKPQPAENPAAVPRFNLHVPDEVTRRNPSTFVARDASPPVESNHQSSSFELDDIQMQRAIHLRQEIERREAALNATSDACCIRCSSFLLRLLNMLKLLYGLVLAGIAFAIVALYSRSTTASTDNPTDNGVLVAVLVTGCVVVLNSAAFGPWFCGWCLGDRHRLAAVVVYCTLCFFIIAATSFAVWFVLSNEDCNSIIFGFDGNVSAIVIALEDPQSACETFSSSSDVVVALDVLGMGAAVAVALLSVGLVLPTMAFVVALLYYGCNLHERTNRQKRIGALREKLIEMSVNFENRQQGRSAETKPSPDDALQAQAVEPVALQRVVSDKPIADGIDEQELAQASGNNDTVALVEEPTIRGAFGSSGPLSRSSATAATSDDDSAAVEVTKTGHTVDVSVVAVSNAQPLASIAHDSSSDEDNDERMCVVCWDSPKDTLIQPCNHMCLCYECATTLDDRGVRISQCPMCRGNVVDIIKVFF